MTRAGWGSGVRALLLDIEGTTTPIGFVYGTLFPYARRKLAGFVADSLPHGLIRQEVEALRQEHQADRDRNLEPPPWEDGDESALVESVVAYLEWLMEHDRKSTPLKSLQGRIWEEGYRGGELRGLLYPDVRPAFERWKRQGRRICLFSSGSVLAQQLLFSHSSAGDVTPFIDGYFDTTTGSKRDSESYATIAEALSCQAPEVLFLSDVLAELDAAREAGMQTGLCLREAEPPPDGPTHPVIRTFDEVLP